MEFRLIDTGFNIPSMNMAIDEALLSSELPVLRFYRWNPAGLSIGYFQKIKDIDIEFCNDNHIGIVRRLTGGSAVLHDDELTYSMIIDESRMPKTVIDSYKIISSAIIRGLGSLGLDAEMNEQQHAKTGTAICFNEPSWYEILVNKKKIVGSAQKRIDGKLLQHGSVLLSLNMQKYAGCFRSSSTQTVENMRSRITSINEELDGSVGYDVLKEHLIDGFNQAMGLNLAESQLTKEELSQAKALEKEKYSLDIWNKKL